MSDEETREERAPAGPRLKLRRLKIHKWRNVLPGTELHFGDGIHALLGKNGTGKTTLLKLISMCVRGDFSELGDDDFSFEYEAIVDGSIVNVTITQERAEQIFATDPRLAASQNFPNQLLKVSLHTGTSHIASVTTTGTSTHIEDSSGSIWPFQFRLSPHKPFVALVAAQIQRQNNNALPPDLTRLGQVLRSTDAAFRFDEMLGTLRCIEGHRDEDPSAPTALSINVITNAHGPLLLNHPLMPGGLDAQVLRSPDGSQSYLRIGGEALPFLRTCANLCGFRHIEFVLPLVERRQLDDGSSALVYRNAGFAFELPNGDLISHAKGSHGQKRLLSFLYYAACNPAILIADELTNGLHHEWIEACVNELEKRQSFVATQNPLLLDYLPVNSAKDAETAFIQCRLVEQDGKQWMHWRNTTPEEAERFWKSYETGVQFISEILRTEGLW